MAAVSDGAIEPVPPLPSIATMPRGDRSYAPRLSLEGIGSPYLSAGGGPLGGYVSGGGSMLFGDLLGDHQLLTAVYVSSRLDESAFGAMYLNRASRWNWGLTVDQSPDLRIRSVGAALDPEREHVLTRTRERLLWTSRRLGGFASYPLHRSQRIEVSGAMRAISFSREQRIEQVSTRSGMVVDADSAPLPSAPSVGIAEAGRRADRRLGDLRRHRADAGQPLPLPGHVEPWRPPLHQRARRLSPIPDAGPAVHDRAAAGALGTLRR